MELLRHFQYGIALNVKACGGLPSQWVAAEVIPRKFANTLLIYDIDFDDIVPQASGDVETC